MSNETPAAIDPDMFAAVFSQKILVAISSNQIMSSSHPAAAESCAQTFRANTGKSSQNQSCPRLSRMCKKRRVFRKRRAALLLHLVVCIWHEQHKFGLVFAALVPVSPSSGSCP